MRGIRFDRLTNDEILNPGKIYQFPTFNLSVINCVRAKKGNICFGWSDMKDGFHKANGGARFWKRPRDAMAVRLPDFKQREAGYSYGEPEWKK